MAYSRGAAIGPQVPITRQEDPALRAMREARERMGAQQEEAGRNDLLAQKYALDNSVQLQGDSGMPRQVRDTSMTIPYGGGGGASGSGSGKVLPPHIEGRYMDLVSGTSFTPTAPNVPRESLGPNTYGVPDAQAFQDAEFGRAKARAGDLGRSSINALRSELSGRGILGSGTELRGTADRISSTLQPLADLNVAHLGQDYQASQLERGRSETARMGQYQGSITQRDQDIESHQALQALQAQMAERERQRQFEVLLRSL